MSAYMHTCTHTAASGSHHMKDASPELSENAARETRGIEHTHTRACASMSKLMQERARLESKKTPNSGGSLRLSSILLVLFGAVLNMK